MSNFKHDCVLSMVDMNSCNYWLFDTIQTMLRLTKMCYLLQKTDSNTEK